MNKMNRDGDSAAMAAGTKVRGEKIGNRFERWTVELGWRMGTLCACRHSHSGVRRVRVNQASKALGLATRMLAVPWLGVHIPKHSWAHCDAVSAAVSRLSKRHACPLGCRSHQLSRLLSDSKQGEKLLSETGWSDAFLLDSCPKRSKLIKFTSTTLGERLFDTVKACCSNSPSTARIR